jgi:hypothetical protein
MKKIMLEQKIWFSNKASIKLTSLEPVFNNLLAVHLAYILGEKGKDYPYWYKERPHIGFLAAAVWLSGGTALEEYQAGRKKRRLGRCDLWIRTNKVAFECEAKRLWLNLEKDTEELRQKIGKKLDSAAKEVENLEKGKGLALCFAMPSIHCKSKKRDTLDKLIYDLIESAKQIPKLHALVWIGFKKGTKPMGDPYLFPGLLLAIKEVK